MRNQLEETEEKQREAVEKKGEKKKKKLREDKQPCTVENSWVNQQSQINTDLVLGFAAQIHNHVLPSSKNDNMVAATVNAGSALTGAKANEGAVAGHALNKSKLAVATVSAPQMPIGSSLNKDAMSRARAKAGYKLPADLTEYDC